MDSEDVRIDLCKEPADAERLRLLAMQLRFNEQSYRRALQLAGVLPDRQRWTILLNRFLLIYGVALIVAGIASFFAYNWDGLDKFAKFALLEVGIVSLVLAAWLMKLDSLPGKTALCAAGFLVGVLLAVFGQTYQTGADPYGLFLGWALLVLGWAVIGRQTGLWLLLAVLLNLSLILYWEQVLEPQMGWEGGLSRMLGPFVWLFLMMSNDQLAQTVFVLNASMLLVWEFYVWRGVVWMQGRWLPRVIACFALLAVVAATLMLIFAEFFGDQDVWLLLGGLGFLSFIGVSFWYYRLIRHDLFILACCVSSLIIVITSYAVRLVSDDLDSGWLLLSLFIIAQTAAGAIWLRHVARTWRMQYG